MMRYFRVKPETDVHSLLRAYVSQSEVWDAHQAAMEDMLGCSVDENLLFSVQQLGLKEVPESLKKQFKSKPVDGFYLAKENSKIKKQWVQYASDHQLPCITALKLYVAAGVNVFFGAPRITQIVVLGSDLFVVGNDHDKWATVSWAEEYTERHFFELQSANQKGAITRELVEHLG